ncbi:AIG1 family protein, partial [Entamoeba histolytica HM-3:IMSS]
MNYNDCKFTDNIKQVIETINDVFKIKDIWKHVCIVWTKCYYYIPEEDLDEGKKNKEQFKQNIISFINQINKTNETIDIKMYYVDSKLVKGSGNIRSEKEIERLIKWGRGLKSIDEKEINKLVDEYKEILYEEKEEEGETLRETEFKITYEINIYRRCIKIKNNGEKIVDNWVLFSTKITTEKKKTFMEKVWGVVKPLGVISLYLVGGVVIGAVGGAVIGAVGGGA